MKSFIASITSALITLFLSTATVYAGSAKDYLVSLETNGIYVYGVDDGSVNIVEGSPFSPTYTPYGEGSPILIEKDPGREFIYALYTANSYLGGSSGGAIYTFKMDKGVPTQTSVLRPDFGFGGGCGHCAPVFTLMSASAHFVFVINQQGNDQDRPQDTTISIFRSEDGVLKEIPSSPVTFNPQLAPLFTSYNYVPLSIVVDSSERLAYISFASPASGNITIADSVAIYDLREGFSLKAVIPAIGDVIFENRK
jgi:hypothetical protein